MQALAELYEKQRQAVREWLDWLERVDDMLRMRVDEPGNGSVETFRAAHARAEDAGRRLAAIQIQIAELEGPGPEM